MGRLEEMLDEADSEAEGFYAEMVQLHNDERLRSLMKCVRDNWQGTCGVSIIDGEWYATRSRSDYGMPRLRYTSKGFVASVPRWVSEDWRDGWYRYELYAFRENHGRLICHVKKGIYKGRQEILELFPDLTLDEVRARLESEVEGYAAKRAAKAG